MRLLLDLTGPVSTNPRVDLDPISDLSSKELIDGNTHFPEMPTS